MAIAHLISDVAYELTNRFTMIFFKIIICKAIKNVGKGPVVYVQCGFNQLPQQLTEANTENQLLYQQVYLPFPLVSRNCHAFANSNHIEDSSMELFHFPGNRNASESPLLSCFLIAFFLGSLPNHSRD